MVAARRGTAWDDLLVNQTLTSAVQDIRELMQLVADPEKRGCTLIRTIIDLTFHPVSPGQVSGQQAVDLGIGLVSADARVAGAVPDSDVSGDFPVSGWIYRNRVRVVDETIATGIVDYSGGRIEVDIRGQRKLDRSDVVLISLNTPIQGTAFNVNMLGIIRMLYKLP